MLSTYPASRVSFDLPTQIGKRKETLRAASRFFDPPLIRENGWVSPVSCRWNRFLLTRMIIRLFLSGISTAIRMHKCRDHANCTRANKLSLGTSDWTIPKRIKLITFYLTKIIRFIRSLSLVQFVALRQIGAEINYLRVDLLDLRVIHACEWPLRNPTCPSSVINFKEYLMQLCLVS